MDRKAVSAARTEFERAYQSITELGASNNFAEIERHWTSFLVSAGRVFTKLEQGSKSSAKTRDWWSKKVHQRRTDPLLCYIWHARNADEHTIVAVTEQHTGGVKFVDPTPEEQAAFLEQMKKLGKPYLALATIEVTRPHVRLLDVVDRGVRYSPPQAYPNPHSAGMLALAQLEAILVEAEKLVVL